MKIFISEFKSTFSLKRIFYTILFINLLVFLWAGIYGVSTVVYSSTELLLVILGITLTTHLYRKYNNEIFLKKKEFDNFEPKSIKFQLFFIVFTYLLFVVVASMASMIIFSWMGLLPSQDLLGEDTVVHWLSFDDWSFFIYAMILEILIIIAYAFFLNTFVKSKIYLNGFILVVIIWAIFFGNSFYLKIYFIEVEGVNYMTIMDQYRTPGTILSLIFQPWTQLGIIGKGMFIDNGIAFNSEYDGINSWWNYSQMGAYKALRWTPYLFLLVLVESPNLFRFMKKK